MTKKGLAVLIVLTVILAGAIGGVMMFLEQQEAFKHRAQMSPAVTLGESADDEFIGFG